MKLKEVPADSLFCGCGRFDLIYKLLYVEHINDQSEVGEYYKNIYLDSIETFNGFYEDEPRKTCKEDFINSFVETYNKIKIEGFNKDYPIPVNEKNQIYDGAHRLTIATYLGENVFVSNFEHNDIYDYKFFLKRGINRELADIGALEFVKHFEKAHIVQIFPIVSPSVDNYIEEVLSEKGLIYYKKSFFVNYNGLVRIKKINYGSEEWAGNQENDFKGLKMHASNCVGMHKMRVYVFICDSVQKAVEAKMKIREKLNCGNFPIHINDNHEEAVKLANIYFSKSGLDWINSSKYNNNISDLVDEFKNYCENKSIPFDKICISSSSILKLYGLREAADIDCIGEEGIQIEENGNISSHETERKYYGESFDLIIQKHSSYFVVDGIKFLALSRLRKFKIRRHEWPKDFKDLFLIDVTKRINKRVMDMKTFLYYFPKAKIKKFLGR